MKLKLAITAVCAAGLGLVVTGTDTQGHHSFAAQYDGQKPVTLSGTVAKIEWTNPHIHFYISLSSRAGCSARVSKSGSRTHTFPTSMNGAQWNG